MAVKGLTWKAPSIETLSTSLTYLAMTGALLAPLATATPRLPPAVEAKVSTAAPSDAAAITPKTAASPVAVPAADLPASPETDASRALHDRQPDQIAEVRPRPKAIKAKDAPEKMNAPEKKDVPEKTAAPEPIAPSTALVRITETNVSKGPGKSASLERSLPPATAVVPPASTQPIAADPAAPVTTWNDADVAAALKECLRLLAPVNAEVEVNTAMRKGQCGTPAPILLKSVGTSPKLTFQPAVEINCQLAVALGDWARDTLQPAARDTYGSEVKSIVGASGYSCRNRYGLANERLSEHALANAVDIAGFALANGKTVRVTTGWGVTQRDRVAAAKASAQKADAPAAKTEEPPAKSPAIKAEKSTQRASLKGADAREAANTKDAKSVATDAKVVEVDGTSTPEGQFLRRLHKGACETFGTVLGPEANEAHRDHFHFDMKARKHRAVCQ